MKFDSRSDVTLNVEKEGTCIEICEAVEFAQKRLGFTPDTKQSGLLETASKRILLNCSRQFGKSTIAAVKAVHSAWSEADSLTIVASPTDRQSAELVRKAARFVQRLGVRVRGDGTNDLSILFPNGSRIVGIPGVEGTVRGYSAVSLLLIDEASRVPDDLYRAVRPMLAVSDGSMWLMSTPHGQRGFFWDEWSKGGDTWERVSAPATECSRIRPEFLEEERRSLGERWFRQEYLCEFTSSNDSWIDRKFIDAAFE